MADGGGGGLGACWPEQVTAAMDVLLGSLDERYALGELIGEGRFSQVFVARRQPSAEGAGGIVALKAMELSTLINDDEALEMLEAECSALRLASEHEQLRVVRLHEVVCTPQCVYLALDKVEGVELFALVEQCGALPEPFVRSLMAQLLDAVSALHGIGIIHRDIKPENIIVSHMCVDAAAVAENPPRLTLVSLIRTLTVHEYSDSEGIPTVLTI